VSAQVETNAPRGAATEPPPRPDTRDSAGFPMSGHLQHLDLFRILTFAVVVGVHTAANGSAGQGTAANAVEIVFHYTREAFFFLTGFVLAHSVRNRPLRLRRFWPKRFKLIGIPYLVWSFLYICYAYWRNGAMSGHTFVHLLWKSTLLGQASYHLYFLVVSMQIYLAFPLLNRLRGPGTRHPALLLGSLAVVDGVILQFAHVSHPVGSHAEFWATWAYITIFPYLFWVVGGSVAAWHLQRLQPWLWRHRPAVAAASVAALGIALAVYAYQIHTGWQPQDAGEVMQPVFLLWGTGAICLQAILALAWIRHRRPDSRATRAVVWGSSASFGVYLIHPIVLDRVFAHGLSGNPTSYLGQPWTKGLTHLHVGQPGASFLAWAVTLALSCLLVGLIRLTPLSMPLTGREWGWERHRDRLRGRWRGRRAVRPEAGGDAPAAVAVAVDPAAADAATADTGPRPEGTPS
jgi:peptidoglycan/LPS O-acetylase OafA/YrhL